MRKVFTTLSMPAKEQLTHQAPWKATVTQHQKKKMTILQKPKLKITEYCDLTDKRIQNSYHKIQ